MSVPVIVTNFYPGHFHYEPFRRSLEAAGYKIISIARRPCCHPDYRGPAVAQFIFNYPISRELQRHVLTRIAAGQPTVVMMDDPLAFFDQNINKLIVPVLKAAARVYTSTDNMLPIYSALGIEARLLIGLGNPLYDVAEPIDESQMRFDWGFIGTLIPQRFRFFWQLQQLLPDLSHYFVTKGFGPKQVIQRIRETRVNIAYGNFSDLPDFKSNSTTLRAWEFPYAGAFILHDERPLLAEFFKENESIVTFRNVDKCAELIKYYIARPSERIRIARNARQIIHRRSMLSFFPKLFQEVIAKSQRT